MEKIAPFEILEFWLNSYINPQVQSVGVNAKKATTMSSSGIEIVLTPQFNLAFNPSMESDLTIGGLPDTILANMQDNENLSFFIEDFKVVDLDEDLSSEEQKYPPIGSYLCPQVAVFSYSDQKIFFKFKKFDLFFSAKILGSFSIVTKFLYYRARFMEYELFHKYHTEDMTAYNWHKIRYIEFLLELLTFLKNKES